MKTIEITVTGVLPAQRCFFAGKIEHHLKPFEIEPVFKWEDGEIDEPMSATVDYKQADPYMIKREIRLALDGTCFAPTSVKLSDSARPSVTIGRLHQGGFFEI